MNFSIILVSLFYPILFLLIIMGISDYWYAVGGSHKQRGIRVNLIYLHNKLNCLCLTIISYLTYKSLTVGNIICTFASIVIN